jgi:hypothetical protein
MLAYVPQQMPSSASSETFASHHVVAAVAACATARLRACAIHVTFSGFTNPVRTANRMIVKRANLIEERAHKLVESLGK